jgi:uncharacterized membrane protein
MAQSQALYQPAVSGVAEGIVQVTDLGVQVEILSGPGDLLPNKVATWQLQVTNVGAQADTYDLSTFGPLAAFTTIIPATVTLNPGGSQTVSLVVGPLPFSLPQDYLLGAMAQSRASAAIRDEDTILVTIGEYAAVVAAWLPRMQVIEGSFEASYSLLITNTGNVGASYQVDLTAVPQAAIQASLVTITLPAGLNATLLVTVKASSDGFYYLTAHITGEAAQTQAIATLQVGPQVHIWLPVIVKTGP